MFKNKPGIADLSELALAEEKIGKTRALELFDRGLPETFEVGTFAGLTLIHQH